MIDNEQEEKYDRNIKVFVRILPLEKCCETCARIDRDRKKIYVRCLQEMRSNKVATSANPSYWCFRTDGIFYNSPQEEIYRTSARDLVQKVLDGVNCVLIGHGQVGSGKSFSIGGLNNHWEHRGLVTRLLSDMFAEKAKRKKVSKIKYQLSFVELRGQKVIDLLSYEVSGKIKISDRDAFKDVSIVNANTEEETLEKIFQGEARRSFVKGSTYPVSHLATAIITFHVTNISLITSWGFVSTAKLHIVETAGIGTIGKMNSCKPSSDIGAANLTKTQIEQFFMYFGDKNFSCSAIRSSNFFKILGDAFSATSIIRFISHIRITREDLDITLSTLRFGAKIIKLKPVKTKENIYLREDLTVQRLRDEVDSLKRELMINDMFLRQETTINVTKSRAEQIHRKIYDFLNDRISDFTLLSVSQAQVLLKSIKDLYNRLTVRELEVEKLKETCETIKKTLMRSNASAESSKETVVTVNGFVNNRKSDKSSIQALHETSKEGVGSLDKTAIGVTLGPDSKDTHIYEILETDKKSRKISEINNQDFTMIQELFERFLEEEKEYAVLKGTLRQNEKTLDAARERFSITTEKYYQVKRNLENAKGELTKQQEMRRFMKYDYYVYDIKNIVDISEIEKNIEQDVACFQRTLINLEAEVTQAQNEIRELILQRLTINSKLESAFRRYYEKNNPSIQYNEDFMKLLLDFSNAESLENIKRRFDQQQRLMTRKIKEKQRRKNAQSEKTIDECWI